MKDFPVFVTAYGAASLTLREVPYTGRAYITVQSSRCCRELIRECVDFCRSVGAKKIYASGDPALAEFPFHTAILQMQRSFPLEEDTDAALFPVTDKTAEQFRSIYNEKMEGVENAAWMDKEALKQMVKAGSGYFVHRGKTLLGIGEAAGNTLRTVISLCPGSGREVVLALCHAMTGDSIRLTVASTNGRAIHLYEKLGFLTVAEKTKWYEVF